MEKLIKFEEKEYKISNEGFYPIILFKRIKGRSTPTEDLEDIITFLYCYFKAYNSDFKLELEEFLMKCGNEPLTEFTKFLIDENKEEDSNKKKVIQK